MYRVSISNSNPSGFEARKCNAAAGFGTATKAYGLELNPCRPCPANMDLMTINNNQWNQNQYSENGNTIAIRVGNDILYVDPTACVTRPGYGELSLMHTYHGQLVVACSVIFLLSTLTACKTYTRPQQAATETFQGLVSVVSKAPLS